MLRDLVPAVYPLPFGSAVIRLRYNLASFLRLEEKGLTYKIIFNADVDKDTQRVFFECGLVDKLDPKRVDKIIDILGDNLLPHLQAAMLSALPKADPLSCELPSAPSDEDVDYQKLYTLYVDVMHRTDEEFWGATLGEIIARWQSYAICKGYAKPPKKMRLYDD